MLYTEVRHTWRSRRKTLPHELMGLHKIGNEKVCRGKTQKFLAVQLSGTVVTPRWPPGVLLWPSPWRFREQPVFSSLMLPPMVSYWPLSVPVNARRHTQCASQHYLSHTVCLPTLGITHSVPVNAGHHTKCACQCWAPHTGSCACWTHALLLSSIPSLLECFLSIFMAILPFLLHYR